MPVTGLLAGARGFGMFAAGPASDFVLIQSTTVGSGGASSITFSNIPQGFRHLQVRGVAKASTTGLGTNTLNIRINSDSGNNYAWHYVLGDGASASSGGGSAGSIAYAATISTSQAVDNNIFGGFVIDLLDYASTSKNKTVRSLAGLDRNGTDSGGFGGAVALWSDLWVNTSAITTVAFLAAAGNLQQHSTFSLYALR